jgi:hypothetical protein
MKLQKRLSITFLFSFFVAMIALSPTSQAMQFGVLGGVNQTHQSQPADYSSQSGFIGGVSLNFPFLLLLDIEADALYEHQTYKQGVLNFSSNHFQIPVLARLTFFPFFNIGGGIYYEFASGSNNGYNGNDFGLASSIQFKLPLAAGTHLIADARYLFGLRNLGNDTVSYKNREVNLMAGLCFDM